eukprot:m.99795 g.99795  ORF g.99795 m.99795 type:complete len:99 (+) comp13683_c0_seq9:1114-1410(+)
MDECFLQWITLYCHRLSQLQTSVLFCKFVFYLLLILKSLNVIQVLVTCWAAPSGERLILMVNHGETAAYLSVRMYDADKNGYVQNATLPPFTVQWQPF